MQGIWRRRWQSAVDGFARDVRLFPNGDGLNRRLWWSDPIMAFIGVKPGKRRIVGVVPDVDDENVVPGPMLAGVALLIAVVGVSGVLAFSVSARTREFGVRLATGATPRHLLTSVLSQGGALIALIGIVAGAVAGYALARVAGSYLGNARLSGPLPVLGAAAVLIGAAVVASFMPAARASRVDVMRALRSE